MELSQKHVDEFKKIYKETKGVELSDSEASESAHNLLHFVKLMLDLEMKEQRRKAKLKEFPKGFHYDDGGTYNCPICYAAISNEQIWYDDCGFKCLDCQENLKKRKVPKSVFRNRDSWYDFYGLEREFGVVKKDARRLVKEGKLKMRTLINRNGRPYYYLFLKKDNPLLK